MPVPLYPIDSVRYTNAQGSAVGVVMTGGQETHMNYPATGRWQDSIDAWLAEPNTITPYPIEELKTEAYLRNQQYGEGVIAAAELQPDTSGPVEEHRSWTKTKRRNARAKKNANVSAADDAFFDFEDQVWDAVDLANDDVEAMSDPAAVQAWQPTDYLNWPTWTPPAP